MAKLAPGALLEVRWRDGRIEIEPVAAPVRLRRRGRLLVAEPKHAMPVLTEAEVERTRSMILDERSAGK